MVYIQDSLSWSIQDSLSWSLGFAISTTLVLLPLLFFLGTPLYVHVAPKGSIFSGILQVFVAAFRNHRLPPPPPPPPAAFHNPISHNHHAITPVPPTPSFLFLSKAAIPPPSGAYPPSPWRLCTLQQVEEVKCLIRIIPIWTSGIICFVALGQQWTFSVLQSMKMNRHLGPQFMIPPGSVGTIAMLGLALFIPVYDMVVVPVTQRITKLDGGITLLQRQGVGLLISIFSMVVAAAVEKKRRDESSEGVAISVMWLAPQLLVMGVAEAFNAVGQIEFYNRQFPEHMQTLAGALFFCSLAGSSYLSSLLMAVVKKMTGGEGRRNWLEDDIDEGRVDYFYYFIAIIGVVNFIYFLICASFYRYKRMGEVREERGEGDFEVCKVES
ncbi:protein NRT1/ PTR FAMILY 2.13-like [Phalaenopsis equestris]|uniref:protein NRT1/ PTR FAMILY 2.13-like n=1 Tax=Phalaenopsis equestris TaxID=78828 RepID=UPI0009E26787|nr:protein NRT1/ PTR FAMILY 2.13-like [Phalaenopsis equestris]